MEFRILGPLEVVEDGVRLAVRGAKQRGLLAILLLHANEVVSADRLLDGLWEEQPPATAQKALQVYVSQLRKLLGAERVQTMAPGYLLRVEPDELDLERFQRLQEGGRLHDALSLWRGPPLAEFAYSRFAQGAIARLEELRLVALESKIEADLALGRHAELVGELEDLVIDHPLRERLRAQLMLALYRSGRQAEALEAYQEARRALVEELGIEPDRALQELERSILRQESSLDWMPRSSSPPAASQPRGSFVGRERELAELLAGLEDALAGQGRLLLLGGEPGIGKSRLAEELASRARERGARVLSGRCWEAGGAPAYWPWVQSLRSYLREVSPDLRRAQLGPGAPDVAQMLPELRDVFPDLPSPLPVESEGARFRLFDSTAAFLRDVSRVQPLVLVLDDLHAADAPSLLLLQFVARDLGQSRVLIVGAYRTVDPTPADPLTTALAELVREPVTRGLELGGLAESDVARFIELATAEGPAAGLAETVHAETEGNPLFVGEFVRLLDVEGRLTGGAESAGITIPQTVKEVISRRLRHLSPECRKALTLASVLGREFDLDALERVSGISPESLLDLVDEAMAARVLSEVPGTSGRLRFTHALIRDSFYEAVTTARRAQLHRRVGEALEELYGGRAEPHLAELAYHFFEAVPGGDAGKAFTYARRAGERAESLLAYEEAVRLYLTALGLLDRVEPFDSGQYCELLLRLGDAQARAGDTPAAKQAFREAASLARTEGWPEQLAHAALGYGGRMIWSVSRDDMELAPLLEDAIAALGSDDSILRARLLARLAGGPLRDASVPAETRNALSEEALAIARRLGDRATFAYTLIGYVCSHQSPEHTRENMELATELLQVAEEVGDKERAVEGHEIRVAAFLELGDIEAAQAEGQAMAALAAELRQPAQAWLAMCYRAVLVLLQGRLIEAEAVIGEAHRLGALSLSWSAEVAFRLQLYALRREQGRLGEVEELVRRSVDEYPTYPVWHCVLADMLARLGDEAEALEAFEMLAGDDFSSLPFDETWLVSMGLLSEVAGWLSDEERARAIYGLLLPYGDRIAFCYPELSTGSVARYLGILASTLRRFEDAEVHFESALELDRKVGARPSVGHSQHEYARLLLARNGRGDRARAEALLADASATASQLGLTALAGNVAGALERLRTAVRR
jgi:DNA-binding SARP family transcriptional activator